MSTTSPKSGDSKRVVVFGASGGVGSQVVDLEWTIARFTRPIDRPARGSVRAGFLGRDKIGSAITRADIATFLLEQFGDSRFIRAAPAISN